MKTNFRSKVFAVVAKIPPGRVRTYGEVARLAGKPGASRAVGAVLSKNWNLAIPCHRVIRSDGTLGGYNRGLKRKRVLLRQEGYLK